MEVLRKLLTLMSIYLMAQIPATQAALLQKCTNNFTATTNIQITNEWYNWGMFYSYCFQINSTAVDKECSTEACKACIYPCYLPLDKLDLATTCDTECVNNFNTVAEEDFCKNGCGYYRSLLGKSDAVTPIALDNSKLPNDVASATRSGATFNSNTYSWTSADVTNIPTVYLVTLYVKTVFESTSVLGLSKDLEITVNEQTICNNKGNTHNFDVDMKLQLNVQPINLNGRNSKNTGSTLEVMEKLPPPTSLSNSKPVYEKSVNVPTIRYNVSWQNPSDARFYDLVKQIRLFYNLNSCTDSDNEFIMVRKLTLGEINKDLNVSSIVFAMTNTDNDNLETCTIDVQVIPKLSQCLVGQHAVLSVKYNGCEEVDNYPSGTCNPPTTPKPTDSPVTNYQLQGSNWRCQKQSYDVCFRNTTVNKCGQCFNFFNIDETHFNCSKCEQTVVDLTFNWTAPVRTATPLLHYILRYGPPTTLKDTEIVLFNGKEVTIQANQTSYFLSDYIYTGRIAFTVHPQTTTPDEQFMKVSATYFATDLEKPTDLPVTNYQLQGSNERCVIENFDVCFKNITLNECGKCINYININETHFNCSKCEQFLVDITFTWKAPYNTSTPLQHYILRYGPVTNYGGKEVVLSGGKEVQVPPDQTSYVLFNYTYTGRMAFAVHPQTSTFGSQFAEHFSTYFARDLTMDGSVPTTTIAPSGAPVSNDDSSDGGVIAAAIIVPLILAILLIILFIFWRKRRHNQKKSAGSPWSNDEYYWQNKNIVTDEWEVFPESIVLDDKIGEGAFGTVFSANIEAKVLIKTKFSQLQGGGGLLLSDKNGRVAVKLLKEGAGTDEMEDFREEIHLMKSIGYHKNIVNLIGCSTIQKPLCLIVEFLPYGDLLHFLRKRRSKLIATTSDGEKSNAQGFMYTKDYQDSLQTSVTTVNSQSNLVPDISVGPDVGENEVLTANDLISFAWQIASGMEYLAANNMVHRDLAARNILVGDDKMVKISDFGLTRRMSTDMIYMSRKSRKLPIKWMSVEAIFEEKFTSASDVWSYGIVLFEIVTLGGTPYPSVANRELLSMLKSGYRMEKPDNCAEAMYDIMLHCWNEDPEQRPNFTELREHLENIISDGDNYFSFEINADNSYYNVASFKSVPSESEDEELFDEVMKNRNENIKTINETEEDKENAEEDRKLEEKVKKLEGEDPFEKTDESRYFSPKSLKDNDDKLKSLENGTTNGKVNDRYIQAPVVNGKNNPALDDVNAYMHKDDSSFSTVL